MTSGHAVTERENGSETPGTEMRGVVEMDDTTQRVRPGWIDRLGALCGPAYVVLILAGNTIAEGGNEPGHVTGAQVLASLEEQAGSTAVHIGVAMELLGFVAFAFFVGWLANVLSREANRAPWLGTVVLVGGISTLAVKIGSVVPDRALDTNRDAVGDSTARLLNDMGAAGFVLSFLTFGIFMLAVGLAALDSGLAGRVAGWSAVVIGALGIIAVLVMRADPWSTSALPFMVGLLWILVVGIKLALRRPGGSEDHSVRTARAAHV